MNRRVAVFRRWFGLVCHASNWWEGNRVAQGFGLALSSLMFAFDMGQWYPAISLEVFCLLGASDISQGHANAWVIWE